MNFPLLRRYVLKAAATTQDPALQNDMIQLLQQLSSGGQPTQGQNIQDQEDEEVVAPDLHRGLPSQNQKPKGLEDMLMRASFPEIQQQNPETPEVFGKLDVSPIPKVSMLTLMKRASHMRIKMSAYIKDTHVSELPDKVREDIKRFIPKTPKDPIVIHYGMMVRELVDRADPQNWKSATEAVKKELDALKGAAKDEARDALFKKLKDKYILLVNDAIVDGHHFLAKARYFNVTSSLNVIDLTPARFQ